MTEPARRSALDGHYRVGRFGADSGECPGVVMAECRPRALVQVNGAPAPEAMAEALGVPESEAVEANRTFRVEGVTFAWNGPGQWLVESAERPATELTEAIGRALGPPRHGASTTDLSHARTVVSVSGAAAEDLLAKLCPIDVESMRVGDSAATLAGPLNAQVVKTADDAFRLYVFRSFGLALWEMLRDEAAEFGGEVVPTGRA